MSANRGLFGRNRRPHQVYIPEPEGGKSSKARKKEEATEQAVALLGDVAAGYYGGDPSANPTMLALPAAPPPYVPEPIEHPHLGFIPIELPGGALLPSEDDVLDDETDDDDPNESRRFRRGSRRRRRRARQQAESDARELTKASANYSAAHDQDNVLALGPAERRPSELTSDRVELAEEVAPIAFEWSADLDRFAEDDTTQKSTTVIEPEVAAYAPPPFAERVQHFTRPVWQEPAPQPARPVAPSMPRPVAQPVAQPMAQPAPVVAQPAPVAAINEVTLPGLDRRQGSTGPLTVVAPKSERVERLSRGLEFVFESPHLWTLSSRVINQVVPDANAELLTSADDGALGRSLVVGPDASHQGCSVPDREMCPAMRLDRVMRFESSEYLDACPFLAIRDGEPVSAVCIPFRSQRALAGVLHTTAPVDAPTSDAQADELTVALALIGKRNYEISGAASEESSAEILESTIEALVERGTRFAVALVHLDNFRLYNRAHGLDIGDAAVQRFDQIARRVVRPEDLVAGDGGDEFFMVFPQTTAKGAAVVCDRIRSELAASFVDNGVPRFTVSIGVADTDDGATFDELLAVIERAVVHAEAAGHDLVVSTKIIAARQDEIHRDLAAH